MGCRASPAVLLAPPELAFPGPARGHPPVPQLLGEAASSGIAGVYAGDWEYMVGGGVATFDCNEDGRADLLLPGGAGRARFYRNVGATGGPIRFAAEESGLELDAVAGAYPLDVDGDGV